MAFERKSMGELEALSEAQSGIIKPFQISILLEDVRSMQNVGSVFRTSDALGLHTLYLAGYTPRPPHRDIQKTALGATETVPWVGLDDALVCLQQLKAEGVQIVAVEQTHNSTPLHEFVPDLNKAYLLVFGNEVDGVSDAVLAMADAVIEIPQVGAKHSLNVSVSAGMVLWELARYRFLSMNPKKE